MHTSNNHCVCDRLKQDGETFKTGPLIGRGFLTLIDSVFWYLSFVSSKQAQAVREKADLPVTEGEWNKKFNLFTGEQICVQMYSIASIMMLLRALITSEVTNTLRSCDHTSMDSLVNSAKQQINTGNISVPHGVRPERILYP